MVIAFFLGACLITLIVLIYFAVIPPVGGQEEWNELQSSLDVYIVTFVVVFILFATGAAIQIFRLYSVNYAFIFEVDQNYKMIHHQMYKVALIFFFIWGFCWLWQMAREKTDWDVFPEEATFSLVCILMFILLCIQPFRLLFR